MPREGESTVRRRIASITARVAIGALALLLPVLPAVAALALLDGRYLRDYRGALRRFHVHLRAIAEGPADTFFGTAIGAPRAGPPVEIAGHCVQCGNCCMNHRCAFLEPRGGGIFQCGIYTSPLRRFSNCAAFPVDARDIVRYDCPSYFVVGPAPVRAEAVRIVDPHIA